MILCVIPARGGSKRIPGKNIRVFHGRPMISWSITAALESNIFDHVIVSTDDEHIIEIAKAEGAEVPFLRPADLAGDLIPTVPVIAHAITQSEALWGQQNLVCCLYATAPFVQAQDIVHARAKLVETGARYAFPVTSFPFPIQRAVRILDNDRVAMFQPECALTRSQDLEEGFHDVGQFYWGKRDAWLAGETMMGPNSTPLVIPRYRAQDIDTLEDWDFAERLFGVINKP